MELFDFITREEMDDLPEDGQQAFIRFVEITSKRLDQRVASLKADDYVLREDAQHSFQNVVLGAARTYKVEPLSQYETPHLENYQTENYRQFRADLTHYLTQMVLSAAIRERNDTTPIPPKSADTIRARIFYLREAIDKDGNLSESKRARLHTCLNDLEHELTRRRVRLLAVARVVYELLALPGAVSESYEAIQSFSTYVMHEIGEAKIVDNENRQLLYDAPQALLPPRKPEPERAPFERDIDGEIPF